MPHTMKETEDSKKELFQIIYFNDLDKLVKFKTKYPELYTKNLIHYSDYIGQPFDLSNLTLFNYTVWFTDTWVNEIIPFIKRQREKVLKMIDFWRNELGEDIRQRNFQYNHYHKCCYCEDPSDDEIICEPFSYYLEKGNREIDLMLYNRATCFDFESVKQLLEKGANPNIDIENPNCQIIKDDLYNEDYVLSRISTESIFLPTCLVVPAFEDFEKNGCNKNFDVVQHFGYLLGWAAHEKMYKLLDEYSSSKKSLCKF